MNLLIVLILSGAAYIFGSIAVDTGRWLFYFLTVVTLLLAIRMTMKFLKRDAKR